MKKDLVIWACAIPLMVAGLTGGCSFPEQNQDIQSTLREARVKLESNYTGPQSEMTVVSQFQLQLAMMELYHVRYSIWNRSDYGKIEAGFRKDEQIWKQAFKKEQEKPSEFEGGSLAPMDHNLRMTAFIEKRIAELKSRWCGK